MAFSTGPIENVGASPSPAARAFVKVLNPTGRTITGVARSFRCDGTRQLIQQTLTNIIIASQRVLNSELTVI